MFYLHARRTLATVSSDYKHLTPNHTIPLQNLLIMVNSLEVRCTQPLRSKYAIIIFTYRKNLPIFLLNWYPPVRVTNLSNALCWAPITPSHRYSNKCVLLAILIKCVRKIGTLKYLRSKFETNMKSLYSQPKEIKNDMKR